MVRLAVVQLDAAEGASADGRAAAIAASRDAVTRAGHAGCDLVVLPEYASGWAAHLVPELAEPEDGPYLTAVREAAAASHLTVVAGGVVPAGHHGRARNVTWVIGADGAIEARYAKVHRYDAFGAHESDLLDAGDPARACVLDLPTPGGVLRLGVVTCYDLRFPESFRALLDLAGDGAGSRPPDVVAVGAAWAAGPDKAQHLRVLARARAIENTAFVALASQSGAGRVGGSAVIDPRGAVLAQVDDGYDGGAPSGLGLAVADLDLAGLARVRAAAPVLAHRAYRVVPAT